MSYTPLAEKLRPTNLSEVIGQEHLTGPQGFISRAIQEKRPLSILLWGPPGTGKTSIARLYAQAFGMRFIALSAVWDGIGELKKIVKEITETPLLGKSAFLFVDEIHRFNKAQQDAFLPFIENGTLILVGATAENPSFYLNKALLSRMRVLNVNPLTESSLEKMLQRYEAQFKPLPLSPKARSTLIEFAHGDGRYLYNLVENIEAHAVKETLESEQLGEILQRRSAQYDKEGDQHYNLISALHKSVRGSDPDAALYWFSRMLEGGEEPLFLGRRMIRMASEDIGLADPQALPLTITAFQAYQMLGSPEGELALAEALIYLALAPKSNAIYSAANQAKALAQQTTHYSPPKIILNASTTLMKQQGYGKGYQYDHELDTGFSGQNYFPDEMDRTEFYHPVERGFEREMIKRLNYFKQLRKNNI
ncbi:MAG: replication-associated recombination protein A [Parachlamydiaceae bacterium]